MAGNPNGPTGLREGGFILQRGTHSDRPEISAGGGGEGIRGFRKMECGKNKNSPPVHAPTPRLREEGAQGHCAPGFSDLQGTGRSGAAYPAMDEK